MLDPYIGEIAPRYAGHLVPLLDSLRRLVSRKGVVAQLFTHKCCVAFSKHIGFTTL